MSYDSRRLPITAVWVSSWWRFFVCEVKAARLRVWKKRLIHIPTRTYITIAEFFMILPQGPNCWMGLGAFSDRVLLYQKENKVNKSTNTIINQLEIKEETGQSSSFRPICTLRLTLFFFTVSRSVRAAQQNLEPQNTIQIIRYVLRPWRSRKKRERTLYEKINTNIGRRGQCVKRAVSITSKSS